MNRSEHLFQLIHAMSKGEKRAFKLSLRHSGKETSNYAELFDLIHQQNEPNDKELVSRVTNPRLAANLSTVKVQLYQAILKSLRAHNMPDKINARLRMQMDHYDILFAKGLYSQCWKVLNKAKKLAYEYSSFVKIDELSILEHELILRESDHKSLTEFVEQTYPKAKSCREINDRLADYDWLLARARLYSQSTFRPGNSGKKHKFDELMQHELLTCDPETQPVLGQIEYYTIWGLYHLVMKQGEESHHFLRKAVDLIEQNPIHVEEYPNAWINKERLLLAALGRARMYDKFEEERQRIIAINDRLPKEKRNRNMNANIYGTIYNTQLDIDIDRGLFAKCMTYISEVEKHFHDHQDLMQLNARMVMNFNFGYAHLGGGNYRKALVWTNELLNTKAGLVRLDLQCLGRILNLIVHYELGNHDIIASLVRSARRFLKKENRLFEVEDLFLRFANRHLQEPYHADKKEAFEQIITRLAALKGDLISEKTMQYFDLISWLKSKTEKCSMEAVMSKSDRS